LTSFAKNNIYVGAYCSGNTIQIGGSAYVSKKTIAIVVATVDAAIILVYAFMIHFLKYSQKAAVKNVLKNAYAASLYTLNITNLPNHIEPQEMAA
jgi:hypothetical protein